MRRSNLALILILALVAALAAPVRAGWVCLDGTPCAVAPAAFATRDAGRDNCCTTVPVEVCRHGTGAPASGEGNPEIGHCRYAVSLAPDLVALGPESPWVAGLGLIALPLAAPQPELILDAFARAGWPEEADHRPPPVALERPSRAPPAS